MWSILTGDSSLFKVQHLALIPAGKNPGGWLKVNGWREGPQGTIELKPNTNLVLMALSVNQKAKAFHRRAGGQAQARPLHL